MIRLGALDSAAPGGTIAYEPATSDPAEGAAVAGVPLLPQLPSCAKYKYGQEHSQCIIQALLCSICSYPSLPSC